MTLANLRIAREPLLARLEALAELPPDVAKRLREIDFDDSVLAAELAAAHALIDRMGAASPAALRVTKLVLDAPGPHPAADALAQALLLEDDEKRDRMAAFLDKR